MYRPKSLPPAAAPWAAGPRTAKAVFRAECAQWQSCPRPYTRQGCTGGPAAPWRKTPFPAPAPAQCPAPAEYTKGSRLWPKHAPLPVCRPSAGPHDRPDAPPCACKPAPPHRRFRLSYRVHRRCASKAARLLEKAAAPAHCWPAHSCPPDAHIHRGPPWAA